MFENDKPNHKIRNCPYCGKEMQYGLLKGSRNSGLWWNCLADHTVSLLSSSGLASYRCDYCRKIVIDIPDDVYYP